MSKGVVAVLGPSASPASNSIISNICGEKEVSLRTQLAWSRGPMLDSPLTVRPETQFGTMMLISRCVAFVGDWGGMKSNLLVKMMKYLNSVITPF